MRASPYLRGLPQPWLRRLSAAATRRTLPAGAQLATEATPPDVPCLYLVLSGEVSVWSPADPDGIAEIVGEEGPGAIFGSPAITGEEAPVYPRGHARRACLVWRAADLAARLRRADGLVAISTCGCRARRREHELVALLRRTPLFAHVSQPLIRWLVRSSTLRLFAEGEARLPARASRATRCS